VGTINKERCCSAFNDVVKPFDAMIQPDILITQFIPLVCYLVDDVGLW